MDDWYDVPALNHWGAWTIQVRLGTMPDGAVAPIGLRIEPRSDYEGSEHDQRITPKRLRQFPLDYVGAHARYAAHDASDEWERVRLLVDALSARMDYYDEHRARDRATAEADLRELLDQLYTRLAQTSDPSRVRPSLPLDTHPDAFREGDVTSPRAHDAEALNISLTTVHRLLREARTEGSPKPREPVQGKRSKRTKPSGKRRGKKKRSGK